MIGLDCLLNLRIEQRLGARGKNVISWGSDFCSSGCLLTTPVLSESVVTQICRFFVVVFFNLIICHFDHTQVTV